MKVSPLAPALWIAGILTLTINLILYGIGFDFMDPFISIMFYLLTQELSSFVAQSTLKEDDDAS